MTNNTQNEFDIEDEYRNGVEPWHEPVNGDELASTILNLLNKHCVLSKGNAEAITLWVLSTYTINSFRIFPKLLITSPDKRCGKSTTMEVISGLSNRSLFTSNVSSASLFRCIELWQPTLLIDEGDTFLKDNEELRGIINSGHKRRGAHVLRVDGDKMEPRKFSTWSPMCIAMIGKPASTIKDRSITIELIRKGVNDEVLKPPIDLEYEWLKVRQKCQRWYDDNREKIEQHNPLMPKIDNDRAGDNWLPILTIADLIGGNWTNLARYSMSLIENVSEDESIPNMLLADIKSYFEENENNKVWSVDLVSYLVSLDHRPWPEYRKGQSLIASSIAQILKPFNIKPKDIRMKHNVKKGYEEGQFSDAFARYLSKPNLSATPLQVRNGEAYSVAGSVAACSVVAVNKKCSGVENNDATLQARNIKGCSVVADILDKRGVADIDGVVEMEAVTI